MYLLIYFVITEAAEIVRGVSLAVAHLHHMQIAHRDLKVRLTIIGRMYQYNVFDGSLRTCFTRIKLTLLF